jgi:alditol oxidase
VSPQHARRNWAGNVTFAATGLARPGTVTELQELIAAGGRLRPLGTGHSFNRIADSDGVQVSVAGLPHVVQVDPATATVEASAGLTFHQLATALDAQGWALANMGSLPHISLAGACATGTHGSGSALGCLAAGVRGVELVRPDGELVRLGADDPALPGAALSLGALGVVTRLRLAVEPRYRMRQQVQVDVPLERLLADLDAVMAAAYSVSLFSDWSDSGAVQSVWFKSRVGEEVDTGRWGGRPAASAQHPLRGIDPAATTDQLGRPGPWHERLPHFRPEFTPSAGHEQQSEYLLPRQHGADAIAAVAALGLGAVLQVCEIRTVAADGLWLSPFHGRDSVAVHFTWRDEEELVDAAVRRVEEALAPYDPRPHWGKVFRLPPEQVRGHYAAELGRFRELAAAFDPERRLGNAFLASYVYG